MSNRDPVNWKNKLEDVGSLPGVTVTDKNAAWEKLHSRLSPNSRRIKPVWYRVAAACVLFALLIPMFIINKKGNNPVKNTPSQTISAGSTIPQTIPVKENIVNTISGLSEKKTKPMAVKIIKQMPGVTDAQKETVLSSTIDPAENTRETTQLPAVVNTPLEIVVAVPLKKKLKVVHVNELEDDPGEAFSISTPYFEHQPFQLKLMGQSAFTSSSSVSNNKGFKIFKLKSISSN